MCLQHSWIMMSIIKLLLMNSFIHIITECYGNWCFNFFQIIWQLLLALIQWCLFQSGVELLWALKLILATEHNQSWNKKKLTQANFCCLGYKNIYEWIDGTVSLWSRLSNNQDVNGWRCVMSQVQRRIELATL